MRRSYTKTVRRTDSIGILRQSHLRYIDTTNMVSHDMASSDYPVSLVRPREIATISPSMYDA